MDERLKAIERSIYLSMEAEVIHSLMSGNDTQCFTTAQYEAGRDRWIAEITGATRESLGLSKPPIETARKQLRASTLVVEVSPDVWMMDESFTPPTQSPSDNT